MDRLEEVFGRIQRARLKLNPSKCSLFQRYAEFFGHAVSEAENKIVAIRTWPSCRNITKVRAFMKLSGYYRRFVKDFSIIASPLYELMKKNVKFVWTRRVR